MRANATLNSEMYSYCQTQMQHGKLKFLIDDNIAKNKLMSQSSGQKMSIEKRNENEKSYVTCTRFVHGSFIDRLWRKQCRNSSSC